MALFCILGVWYSFIPSVFYIFCDCLILLWLLVCMEDLLRYLCFGTVCLFIVVWAGLDNSSLHHIFIKCVRSCHWSSSWGSCHQFWRGVKTVACRRRNWCKYDLHKVQLVHMGSPVEQQRKRWKRNERREYTWFAALLFYFEDSDVLIGFK